MKKETDNKVVNSLKTKFTTNKESLLYKFLYFIFRPKYQNKEKSNFLKKILNSFRLYTFIFTLIVLLGIIIAIALGLSGYETQDNAVADLVINNSIILVIAIVIFIGPITEELTFRLGLRFSNFKTSFNLGLLVGLIPSFLPENFFSEFLPRLLLTLLIFLVAFLILRRIPQSKKITFYEKHFSKLLYFSILTFGLAHISNYTNQSKIWFLLPLLIAPQLLAGVLFGYARTVYGFAYSILLHMFHNFITVSPLLLLSFLNIGFDKLENPSLLTTQDSVFIGLIFIGILVIILIGFLINIWNLVELFYTPKNKNRSAFVPN